MSEWMRTIRWSGVEENSLEHLSVSKADDEFFAESVMLGERDGVPYGLSYRLTISANWTIRTAEIHTVGGVSRRITSNGNGLWRDEGGRKIAELAGSIDVDIAATPFTNTLPIRRLSLEAGASKVIRVAYVSTPALSLRVDEQRYTRLSDNRYLYENTSTGFSAEITVDHDGIVTDYPGLFRRVDLGPTSAIRAALIAGEESGPPQTFDEADFLSRMRQKTQPHACVAGSEKQQP